MLVILVLAVIVYFQVPTPITPQLTQLKDALFSLNFDRITTALWALIGGLGTATGVAGALAYIYTKTKGALKQTQTSLASTQQQAQSFFAQKEVLTEEKAKLQENSNTVIKQISAEKETATNQLNSAKSELDQTKAELAAANKTKEDVLDKLAHTPVNIIEKVK